MKKLLHEIYVRFYNSTSNKDVYVSIDELMDVGTPIDEDGDDMERVDDYVYYYNTITESYLPLEID